MFLFSNYNCVFSLRYTELCDNIRVNLKNSHVFLDFTNWDLTLYDNISKIVLSVKQILLDVILIILKNGKEKF